MEKKKMKLWKKILIGVLIVLAILVAVILRKFFILKAIAVQNEEDSKATNFYSKTISNEEAISEIWIYGNTRIFKRTSYDEKGKTEREVYQNGDTKQSWIIVNEPSQKVAAKLNYTEDMVPTINANTSFGLPMSSDIWPMLQVAAMSRIDEGKLNGKNAYNISFYFNQDDVYRTWINKEDNRQMLAINGSVTDKDGNKLTRITNYFYKFGEVTQQDVNLPDFSGYTIKDNSGNV